MIKKVEEIFKQFDVTMTEVCEILLQAGCKDYVDGLFSVPSKIVSNPLFFAMASILLKGNVKNVLEIGSGSGSGTNRLSRLFPEATVFTVDIPIEEAIPGDMSWRVRHKSEIPRFKQNLARDNIVFIDCNSFFLPMLDLPKQFDFIFVDGDHMYPPAAADTMFAYHRVRPGGFLFMDNYDIEPNPALAVAHLTESIRDLVEEEILLLPLYLCPPALVEIQRLAMLVKK